LISLATVLFSKDRPLQLDAALRSLELIGGYTTGGPPIVLYTTSGSDFESAYRVLRLQHPNVTFRREVNFKLDLIQILADIDYILFMVDDTLITARLPLPEAVQRLEDHRDLIGFSFRLGRNTNYCYPADARQALPDFSALQKGELSYDWKTGEHDFGYPLEVSASLYRSCDIRPLLGWLPYWNPNSLESELAASLDVLRQRRPRLACPEQSVAVSVPANLVQTEWSNRASSDEKLGAADLLRRFERGERLDIGAYRALVPHASHQELGFVFVADASIPTVTVVVRSGGDLDGITRTVASVVLQGHRDWEIVILGLEGDDDTGYASHHLRTEYPGHRIRIVVPPSSTRADQLALGIEASLARYFVVLDAGEELHATVLAEAVEVLEEDVGLGFATAHARDAGEEVGASRRREDSVAPLDGQGTRISVFRTHIWHHLSDKIGDMPRALDSLKLRDLCIEHGVSGVTLA
jgi:glycosyltransferase involved in cell wall biosynthesis